MKKPMIAAVALIVFLGSCPAVSAQSPSRSYDRMPDNYLNVSFFISPSNIGLMHRIKGGLYGVGGLRYDGDRSDLFFQAGAACQIPRKILFFRLYGGGGLEYSRNRMTLKPYALVGTRFWIFHIDMTYPLEKNGEPVSRFGFSFSF